MGTENQELRLNYSKLPNNLLGSRNLHIGNTQQC